MTPLRHKIGISVFVAGSFVSPRIAEAKNSFPPEMQSQLGLTYEVPCSVCHTKGNTGPATAQTPFALSLRARGLSRDRNSLTSALTQLEADHVDSDGDGTTDVAELRAATDPNSSANASLAGDPDPGYGCGGTAPRSQRRGALGSLMLVPGLGCLVRRRRRGPP
jgi:hypothetical protein